MRHQPKTFWVAAAGVAAMFVGTLGPWMKVLGHGRPGAGGDGQVLLIAALVAVPFLWHHAHEGGTALGAAGLTLGIVGAVFCGICTTWSPRPRPRFRARTSRSSARGGGSTRHWSAR